MMQAINFRRSSDRRKWMGKRRNVLASSSSPFSWDSNAFCVRVPVNLDGIQPPQSTAITVICFPFCQHILTHASRKAVLLRLSTSPLHFPILQTSQFVFFHFNLKSKTQINVDISFLRVKVSHVLRIGRDKHLCVNKVEPHSALTHTHTDRDRAQNEPNQINKNKTLMNKYGVAMDGNGTQEGDKQSERQRESEKEKKMRLLFALK